MDSDVFWSMKVKIAGAIWTGNTAGKSFMKVGGVTVSYPHIVYSTDELSPTICAAHFQPLIYEEADTDKHDR